MTFSATDLIFREVQERDRRRLEQFRCSRGAWYEDEVEDFVNQKAIARALAVATPYRLYVVLAGERLIAVAGHHPELLMVAAGSDASGTPTFEGRMAERLHVLALSVDHHRSRLSDGTRCSDFVMDRLIEKALRERTKVVLTGLVARDNHASLVLCERKGLTSQIEHDDRYLRVSGHFARSSDA